MKLLARAALIVAVAAAAIVGAFPAAAHEGDGKIEVLAAEPAGSLEVAYRVRLTFVADGHPAADATVTVVAENTGGQAITPQPLAATDQDGVYAATVRFPAPGAWTVRFTAVTPPATLERAETVAPPPTTTTTSTTTTTVAPTTSTTTDQSPAGDDSGGNALPIVVAVAAVAMLAAAGVGVARRRRR